MSLNPKRLEENIFCVAESYLNGPISLHNKQTYLCIGPFK